MNRREARAFQAAILWLGDGSMRVFGTCDSFIEVADRDLKIGRLVANFEFFRALLTHGSFDEYHVFCPSAHDVTLVQSVLEREIPDPGVLGRVVLSHQLLLTQELRKQRYDAFHVGGWYRYLPHLARLRAALGVAFPITGVIHSLNTPEVPQKCRDLLESPLLPCDSIVCTSESGRRALRGWIERAAEEIASRYGHKPALDASLAQIPLGVADTAFHPPDRRESRTALGLGEHDTVLLYLGRISTSSKADLMPLLHVFQRMVRRRSEKLILWLAGGTEGPTRIRIEDGIHRLGLAGSVRITPNVDEDTRGRLYAAADVFVSPIDNLQETFGLSIIESMAAGLPVVASDFDGYRDLIDEGETGFRVATLWGPPPEPVALTEGLIEPTVASLFQAESLVVDPEQLHDRLCRLIESPDLCKQMGERGRARAWEKFRWRTVIHSYEELWGELSEPCIRNAPGVQESSASFEVFQHYPSEILRDHDRFLIGEPGERFLDGSGPLPERPGELAVLGSDRGARWLLQALRDTTQTWDALRTRGNESGLRTDELRLELLWLFKYGWIRRA